MGRNQVCFAVQISTTFFCSLQKDERGKGTTAEAAAGREVAASPGISTGNCTEKGCCSITHTHVLPLPPQTGRRLMFRSSLPARKGKEKHSQEQREKEEFLYYLT
ncbi:hypothetical protein ASZ78_012798 [Callipepla squamata]|uniref:Uncharacterized protein n=1 Tax=Callipepla squamata TaxID=9009 RepID=A0A226NAB6_CALSU|nr:hypothetical protein ASZ78_012798 [Callipepla squamata]